MILIISSKFDKSTHEVMQWLEHCNVEVIRIDTNECSKLNFFTISNENSELIINNVNLKSLKIIWHRRGRYRFLPNELNNYESLTTYMKKEEDSLVKSIEFYLKKQIKYIGSYNKEVENFKLNQLLIAKSCGLTIPESIVTNSKKALKEFLDENETAITKDLRYPANICIDGRRLVSQGTTILNKSNLKELNDYFAPIFCQKYIEKKFEIRVFFFMSEFYSMAIFSQADDKTKIDYRNYNRERPNRNVPFKLPEQILMKLKEFNKRFNLKTGSIDIIFSVYNEFVFLEVNPMGQFDWVSKNCNYYIEKKIAENLTYGYCQN